MGLIRTLLGAVITILLVAGLNVTVSYGGNSGSQASKAVLIPMRLHVLTPGPSGTQQIGELVGDPERANAAG
jgi:hypothetical protein